MEELLARYGPIAVLLGAAVQYDATLILAGVVVHLGLLGFPTAVVAGGLGALAGDSFWFALGRRGGGAIQRRAGYAKVAPFVERLAARTGPWEIVLARFVYGTRLPSMLFWGIRGLGWLRFAALDLLGTLLGALVLVTLGFTMSRSATALLGEVERVEKRLLGAAVVAVAAVLGLRWLGTRLRRLSAGPSNPD